jgi:NADPH:quinone reductase-like Zn-dependent oxidoreductase
MKAAVVERYGPPEVVQVTDVPAPEPGAGEVLVQAFATTVNSGDARMRALRVPRGLRQLMRLRLGLARPKQPILGFDTAGEVEAVGDGVTRFAVGDRVVASRQFDFGCHAENVVVAEDGVIARIPDGIVYEDAVPLCFGGSTTLHFFDLARVASGESILVNGASGAVGTMAVQIAKDRGLEVTAVCSAANAELVRGLGADRVVDYATEDFTADGRRYDVVMDNHGNAAYSRIQGSLAPGGRYLMVIGGLGAMIAASRRDAVVTGNESGSPISGDSFAELMAMAERGALRPVVDRVLPFDEVVDAHRRVDTGRKVGSLVLRFDRA